MLFMWSSISITEDEENAENLEECTVCHVDDMKDGE